MICLVGGRTLGVFFDGSAEEQDLSAGELERGDEGNWGRQPDFEGVPLVGRNGVLLNGIRTGV